MDQALDHINMLHKPDLWNMWSLLWARPQAEYRFGETGELYMADRYIQVVGHTPMKEITQEGEHGELISCDVFALDQKKKAIRVTGVPSDRYSNRRLGEYEVNRRL